MNRKLRMTAALMLVVPGYLAAVLQILPGVPIAAAELARFIPYFWLLALTVPAVLLLWRLPLWLVAVVLLHPILVLTFHMGLRWNPTSAAEAPGQSLRVMTFNTKSYKVKRDSAGMAALAAEIRSHNADVVALQDADVFADDGPGSAPRRVAPMFGYPEVMALGQYIIASRYPVQQCSAGELGRGERSRNFLRCTLSVRGTPLTVVTAHFVSPRYSLMAVRGAPRAGSLGWAANLEERMFQADILAQALVSLPRPLVVMGDFNAPQDSPVLAKLLDLDLNDAFSEAGNGWGFTYGHAVHRQIDFLRIDHILVSPELDALSARVGPSRTSDHHAVIADLRLPQADNTQRQAVGGSP